MQRQDLEGGDLRKQVPLHGLEKRVGSWHIKSGIGEEEESRISRTPDVVVETRKLLLCTAFGEAQSCWEKHS